MKIYNTQSFISSMDNILNDYYSNLASRDNFLKLFSLISHLDSIQNNNVSYVRFEMKKIRKNFGRKIINKKRIWILTELIKIANRTGILDLSQYSKDHKLTQGYKYSDRFIDTIISQEINIIVNDIDIKNEEFFYDKTDKNHPQYQLLISDRFSMHMDYAGYKLWDMLMKEEITHSQFLRNQNILINIHKNRIFCSVAENSGRVYSSFTNLKKELRPLCRIDGEELFSMDGKSSQPIIFAHYLKEKYPKEPEVDTFYKMITEGDIYTILGDCIGINRNLSKKEFLKFLYKDNRGSSIYQTLIKSKLPKLSKIILNEKKLFKNNDSNLAIYLQKIEADIFVGSTQDMVQKGLLTIHDSVSCKMNILAETKAKLISKINEKKIRNFKLI